MTVTVLAEKPSQATLYAEAFQNVSKKDGYVEVNDPRFFQGKAFITWGFGHLVELVSPENYKEEWKKWKLENLPMFPETFQFQVGKDKKKQFIIVKQLLKQSDEIIVATDCDREGENIARLILKLAGVSYKPTKRLWINSLEVDEVQKGMKQLKDGQNYISLYKEAQTRQFSDWLVGMNASRLYTLLLQQNGLKGAFSVGRVQTATLCLLYKRQQEIKNFVSQPFFELAGNVQVEGGAFDAKVKQRFGTKEDAKSTVEIHNLVRGKNQGNIQQVTQEQKKLKSPKLHSLSTLQEIANKRWKYSPSEVLKLAQSLYEKKMLSYPRTDSHYITNNEFAYLKHNLAAYQSCLNINTEVVYPESRKRYVNDSKVQEHYAIIPTKQTAKKKDLSNKEWNIYQEVVATTLAMFAGDYVYEETNVEVNVNGICFGKTGKVEQEKGWKALFQAEKTDAKKEDEYKTYAVLPSIREGEGCTVMIDLSEGQTKPPKAYTQGQLINVMKNAGKEIEDETLQHTLKEQEGIGTEATRAGIIDTLNKQHYIEIKKNKVSVTHKGKVLCQVVEGTVLSSPEMTAKWESYLHKIGQHEGSQEHFITKIKQMLESLMDSAPKKMKTLEQQFHAAKAESSIGDCPVCGAEGGKIEDKGKFYGCSRYRDGCTFTLPKRFLSKTISEANMKMVLAGSKTNLIKGFKSKKGKTFDAYLRYDHTEKRLKPEFKKG
ncbi:DNA topoisomerase III [Virgibacillus phasianinus]|uniref:DNA topoisomerase n=1 Tax=Virgibacillus phasianinus TaxID=2017483 RepID=A0A220U0C1_9BACI|nr:type IA DNA topoisomerase [Virgibacillus phasianinus]ASK61353.1 DNA topoisomerase III [Virgibacillus phasianinus]